MPLDRRALRSALQRARGCVPHVVHKRDQISLAPQPDAATDENDRESLLTCNEITPRVSSVIAQNIGICRHSQAKAISMCANDGAPTVNSVGFLLQYSNKLPVRNTFIEFRSHGSYLEGFAADWPESKSETLKRLSKLGDRFQNPVGALPSALDTSSLEYKSVVDCFHSDGAPESVTAWHVTNVIKVDSPEVEDRYAAVEALYEGPSRWFFHGTHWSNVRSICENGFRASKTGLMGRGVYLGSAKTAHDYAKVGLQDMKARVILVEACGALYSDTVGHYLVRNGVQAMPRYVVEYRIERRNWSDFLEELG